jgi:2-dehydro-3-deoxyglucarate aldolase
MNNVSIGTWITLNHPSIAEILADAGFDWLCVDMEHSVTDYFEAQQLIAAIQSKGRQAFVRVGENNPLIIKRVLDAGADGIIVPSVNSRDEALKAVQSVKYPPHGKRGVGLARAQSYGFDFENYRDNKASRIKLIVQIEHIDAIRQLSQIIELEGIDGTFIGPYDLSGSLGKPGAYADDEVQKALEEYEAVARQYDKLIGYHVIEPNYQRVVDKVKHGYNFLAFSVDILFLGTIARQQLNLLKSTAEHGSGGV